jgi:hypothetical protein
VNPVAYCTRGSIPKNATTVKAIDAAKPRNVRREETCRRTQVAKMAMGDNSRTGPKIYTEGIEDLAQANTGLTSDIPTMTAIADAANCANNRLWGGREFLSDETVWSDIASMTQFAVR